MTTVAVDISEYQPSVNDSYPHRWITFRACDGSYTDQNAHANLSWCVRARAAGKIDGFGVYVVYRPGRNQTILRTLDTLGVPHDCVVMVDAESWGGQIGGNHSPELNALAVALSRRQESQKRVWGYGNRSDLASLWPQRPAWLGVVVASYGGSRPTDVPNLVGWQYTDGQYSVPGLPSSSAPFGPCDHNQLYLTATPEVEMPLDGTDVNLIWDEQILAEPAHGTARYRLWAANKALGDLAAQVAALDAKIGGLSGALTALATQVKAVSVASGADPVAIAQAVAAHVTLTAK